MQVTCDGDKFVANEHDAFILTLALQKFFRLTDVQRVSMRLSCIQRTKCFDARIRIV